MVPKVPPATNKNPHSTAQDGLAPFALLWGTLSYPPSPYGSLGRWPGLPISSRPVPPLPVPVGRIVPRPGNVIIGPVPLPPFEPCPLPPGSGGGVRHAFEMLSQLSITQITVIIPAFPTTAAHAPTVLTPKSPVTVPPRQTPDHRA